MSRPIDVEPKHLKVLVGLLQSHLPSVAVWAFGSRVKWTSRPDSDLDLVVFAKPEQSGKVHALKEALEESSLPFRVDVLVWDVISEAFHDNIRKEYVELVGENEATHPPKVDAASTTKLGGWGMSFEWPTFATKPLDSVIKKRNQGVNTTTEKVVYADSGIPVIRSKNIKNNRIDFSDVVHISEKTYEELKEACKPNVGDVLFTNIGDIGNSAVVEANERFIIAWNVLRIQPNESVDNHYLSYVLSDKEVKGKMISLNSSSTLPFVSGKEFGKVEIPFPTLMQQKSIVEILKPIDDRITLLRETNATLEAIAQALFKSWFVDFDPVRAKMEGRAPEGMDEATAALFPDSFEETELGQVPRGWLVKKFEDFVQRLPVGKKFDQKTANAQGCVPILDQGKSGVIGYHDENPGVRANLDEPVVVFANHTCYMRLITYDFSAIQNVLPFKGKGVDTVWAYYATKDRVKFSEYKGHWPDFTIEKAVVPSVKLDEDFRSVVDPLMRRVRWNELQIDSLTDLRDTLLPRLISGKLQLLENENKNNCHDTHCS